MPRRSSKAERDAARANQAAEAALVHAERAAAAEADRQKTARLRALRLARDAEQAAAQKIADMESAARSSARRRAPRPKN